MAIVAKNSAMILPRNLMHYDPATFDMHERSNFIDATAAQVLDMVQPKTIDILPEKRVIAVDTETFYTGIASNRLPATVVRRWIKLHGSKYIPNDFPFCISISDGINSFAVYDTLENQFREFKKLEPLLMDRTIAKTGHNMPYDMHMLANARINMRGRFYDTSQMSRLARGDALTHNLLDVATEIQDFNEDSKWYAPTETKFEHMLSSYKSQHKITDYRLFPRRLMTQYTCADTWNAIWALPNLYQQLIDLELVPLYDTEAQVLIACYNMERVGTRIDAAYGPELIKQLRDEADEAEQSIYDTAGTTFNVNSSTQLHSVIKKLGYGSLVKFKKPTENMLAKGITQGNPKLDKFEMVRLEEAGVPIVKDIMRFRASEKLLNTFAIKLYEMCDHDDTVHCSINTMEAKTGRFSMSAPSMQNMPRRKDSRVRKAFVPPEGFILYDFDFKAQESLIMTHYSRAPYLLDNINLGRDIHKVIAACVYGIDYEEVTKALREVAKSIEFAIVYGAGADKVADMTAEVVINGKKGMTREEAQYAMTTFKRNVPEVDMFIRTANQVIKERGCIKTVMGRRVYSERGREYACVNYLCQGSAADSTKTRMVEIYKFLRANKLKTRMSLQVHDSLLQQVWHEEESYILGWLRWLQTERKLFRVTVQVDVAKCSPTWRDKVDVDVPAVKPPQDMLDKMEQYDIWNEGIIPEEVL